MKKTTTDKLEEKKRSVFCSHSPKGSADLLTFPQFILKCETVLSTVKGVRIYGSTAGIDPKTLSKWAEKIIAVVNTYLSPSAQTRVESRVNDLVSTVTWAAMRCLLMNCFGAETLNETDEFSKMMKITQLENESPNVYYDRLMIAHREYCLTMDFVHGDGMRHSAKIKLRTEEKNYQFYFDVVEDSDIFTNLYYNGLRKDLRNAWELTKHAGEGSDAVKFTNLKDLNRWCEKMYVNKKSKVRRGTSNNQLNILKECSDNDDEDQSSGDERSSKRNKDGECKNFDKTLNSMGESTTLDKMLNVMIQNSADVNKMFAVSNDSLLKICADNNENLNKIFAMVENNQNNTRTKPWDNGNNSNNTRSKPWDNAYIPPQRSIAPRKAMGTVQLCWICKKPDHFAPKCPYISQTELFVIVYNQLYKANLHGARTPGYTQLTFTAACQKWGITPPSEAEQVQIHELYKPLTSKTPRNPSKGPNDKAYCHFCHASGHYTRDCKSQCVYCFQKGHGWKTCTVDKYQAAITARKALILPTSNFNAPLHQVSMLFQAGIFADESESTEEYTF